MNKTLLFAAVLLLVAVVAVGCTGSYSGGSSYNAPPPSGGGCGVAPASDVLQEGPANALTEPSAVL